LNERWRIRTEVGTEQGDADELLPAGQDEPLGLPRGSVRSLLSLGVVLGAFAIAAYLLAADTGSDLTKVVIGGWIAALGNVIGFYFGVPSGK
jgi:hypothetical protein